MILLIPGRHHALTNFQARYLFRFAHGGFDDLPAMPGPVEVVFAVTSADHASTRRNPLPFFLRAMALHQFAVGLDAPVFVYGIPEAGLRDDFAAYTVKSVLHDSDGRFDCRPDNTVVVCATAVGEQYRRLGFPVWEGEATVPDEGLPWNLVERVAALPNWQTDPFILEHLHPASYRLFVQYELGARLAKLFSDPLMGDDGNLTDTRDYGSYVRQMDENMAQKWDETGRWVKPGRIGDVGCAVGSWLKRASSEPLLANSDFYGIEVARPLFEICRQRRANGEFSTPNVWFAQKNATSALFKPGTMNTIHTSSLTHEIESYAGREALLTFIARRAEELAPAGVWINRDVIGPEDGGRLVDLTVTDASRFLAFARDFRAEEGYQLAFEPQSGEGPLTVRLTLRDAAEYLLTKDYIDNWQSEMHETFCHWAFSDWRQALEAQGLTLDPASRAFTNPWILEHRWLGQATLQEIDGTPCPWPPTTVILIARKP